MVSIRQMDYVTHPEPRHEKVKCLAQGTYKGYDFYILSMTGSHPCAYIDTKDVGEKLELNEDSWGFPVHGGITYARTYLNGYVEDSWVIGWDYGHFGDKTWTDDYGEKHKTYDILLEVFEAINHMKDMWEEHQEKGLRDLMATIAGLQEEATEKINKVKEEL